jgi:hypothetical protein
MLKRDFLPSAIEDERLFMGPVYHKSPPALARGRIAARAGKPRGADARS